MATRKLTYTLILIVSFFRHLTAVADGRIEEYTFLLKGVPQKLRMNLLPCSCEDSACGCCATMSLQTFNFSRRACMNFTYNAYDFSLTANMFMNDNSIFESSFSAKNPPAACLPIIIPYIPIPMESCAHFFNICLPGRNVHFCMDWEFRVASQPIAIAHFDCLRLGQSGVSLLKPEDDGCQQPSSTILPLPGYDEYDEVTED